MLSRRPGSRCCFGAMTSLEPTPTLFRCRQCDRKPARTDRSGWPTSFGRKLRWLSLDDLVGAGEDESGDWQTERRCSLHVDGKLIMRRLLDGQIARRCAP